MSKEQKRLAAIFLALMGVLGTVAAMKERQAVMDAGSAVAVESQVEAKERP